MLFLLRYYTYNLKRQVSKKIIYPALNKYIKTITLIDIIDSYNIIIHQTNKQ